MNYYRYCGHTLCSQEALPYEPLDRLPANGEIVFLFSRQPLAGRESFPITAPALLTAEESVETLNASAPAPELTAELTAAIRAGRVRGQPSAPALGGAFDASRAAGKIPRQSAGARRRRQHTSHGAAPARRRRGLVHRHLRPAGERGRALGI